ncbi:hypothetical protein [Microbacterium terrisoli]|jgi:hypothetical protein|uniref:hypothetical protein n=1 Tax=Microbacterium terrisoli TaxID=3242192 RepID=UPI002805C008|nr:hypothetical protein [Microbacterium protaetiae]
MDPLTSLALTVALSAVGYYVLFLVVRSAVLSALRKNREELRKDREEEGQRSER